MSEEIRQVEQKKEVSKLHRWLFIIGLYAVVAMAIVYVVIVFTQLETLKSNPCSVCEKDLGMMCTQVPKYVTGPAEEFKNKINVSLEGVEE